MTGPPRTGVSSTVGPPGGPTAVLVAAAGAGWEASALAALERPPGDVVLARRCVDLPDVLASAGSGTASVAVLSSALPGLDADSVAALRRAGLGVVLVAAPEELEEGDVARLRRLGVAHVLSAAEVAALAQTVREASRTATEDSAVPDHPGELVSPTPAGGRTVAVWGPAGAPGRTTVAVGVATAMARAGADVLLVDADSYGGAVAQHLGVLEEASGLLAAARAANTGRLDSARLAALAREVDGLRVLTGLPRVDRWQEVRTVAFGDVLEQAARLSRWVVLDVGFSLEAERPDPFGSTAPQRNDMTVTALRRADEVVVVGAPDPVGLARLARGLVELSELLPGVRPRVVVNRTRPSLGWSDREIRGMVEGFVRPVDVHFLPDDRVAADRALMAGRSLHDGEESPLASAMSGLAQAVAGQPAVTHRRRRLRR